MTPSELRQQIHSAFASVLKPERDSLISHWCCECVELASDLFPHPADAVPAEVLERHFWDLPLLSDEGKHYYLPAWLLAGIDQPWSDAVPGVVFSLDSDHRWSPATPYTLEQWLAIEDWLSYIHSQVDITTREEIERVRQKLPK
jgi:hypothetical protein